MIVLINKNTGKLRKYLEKQGYRYAASYPPANEGNVITVNTVDYSYATWKSTECFLELCKIIKDKFKIEHNILNCEEDLNMFYEETRKKT